MFHCFSSRLSKAWMECFRVKKTCYFHGFLHWYIRRGRVQEWTGVGGCSFYRSRWLFRSSSQRLWGSKWGLCGWVTRLGENHGIAAQCSRLITSRADDLSNQGALVKHQVNHGFFFWRWFHCGSGDDVTVDYDGQVRCHSFEDQFCQCRQQAVRRWFLQPQKMGWFCRCRTKGASLLETKWCMAKSVVKLCSLKWWHNEWYNTFFYRNLLKVHPPEKNVSTDPGQKIFVFVVATYSRFPEYPLCVFLQDFRLKFVHYKIGHRVTIMSGASVTRYRKMEGWWSPGGVAFLCDLCCQSELKVPSWELTYLPKMAFWRWFSFSPGGIW